MVAGAKNPLSSQFHLWILRKAHEGQPKLVVIDNGVNGVSHCGQGSQQNSFATLDGAIFRSMEPNVGNFPGSLRAVKQCGAGRKDPRRGHLSKD